MAGVSMKRLAQVAILTALMLGASTAAFSHKLLGPTEMLRIVTLQLTDYHKQMQQLSSMDYDIAGVDLETNSVDVIIAKEDAEFLSIYFGMSILSVKEVDPRFAPGSDYTTYAELTTFLEQVATDFPDIVRLQSIGKTTDDRDIWALKITDDPDNRELNEPTILFNSMHHAREIMTTEVAMDIIDQLTNGYDDDPSIRNWVDTTEIWVVPMVNPDGNNKVWNGSSMWRKNTRGGYGVDINRNYPYQWNTCNGSSGSTWSDTYRGPSAGSEPETQALMNLVANTEPVFDISYHSYSELVIYPFGCDGDRTATREVVEGVGDELASKLVKDSGSGTYSPGTAWELLYSVDGGDIDWMYDEYNVIPYVIEVNSRSQGFQPNYRYRDPTVEKMRPGWKFLLDRVHESGVRGVVTDRTGRMEPDTQVTIESLGNVNTKTVTWKIKHDGTYHLVLEPGMYNLTFAIDGRVESREVTVGDTLTEIDVQL
jgi:hypothetical protein